VTARPAEAGSSFARALLSRFTRGDRTAVAIDRGPDRLYDFGAFFFGKIKLGIDLNMAICRDKVESGPPHE
jgi:hypothetical protein